LLSHAYTISLLLSFIIIFFFTDPATTEIYTLSLHDALPISIREWQAAYKLAVTDVPGGVPQLTEALGVAYLHKSEMANDVYRNPVDRCTFPPRANLCYQQTGDSEKAINYFSKYLELVPERPDAVQVKWLLNLAYMTLGKYPDGVPQKYLISPSVFAAKENFGRFMDAAPAR